MSATTLGILAGGAATRMGGRDKAWLERAGIPQVLRWQRRFAGHVDALLVSANRDEARYRGHGLVAVRDLQAALGMTGVRLAGVRFGNLNTPADLALAGVA